MAILMTLLLVMPVRIICCRKLVTHYSRFTNSTDKEQSTNPHAEHRHKVDISKSKGHSHDLGMMAVVMHIAGDALNNIGVIIAAAVIWKAKYEGRFYADPAVGMGIAIMITLSGLPIGNSLFLFAHELSLNPHNSQEKWPNPPREHAPRRQPRRRKTRPRKSASLSPPQKQYKQANNPKVSGALSIHELHIWRLSQHKALASAHVFTTDDSLANWMVRAKLINECLHAYGIHSSTLQPELVSSIEEAGQQIAEEAVRRQNGGCQIICGTLCEGLTCCGREKFEGVTGAVAVTGVHT
jgi:zinc transporter 1